jgi:hypothetical protein
LKIAIRETRLKWKPPSVKFFKDGVLLPGANLSSKRIRIHIIVAKRSGYIFTTRPALQEIGYVSYPKAPRTRKPGTINTYPDGDVVSSFSHLHDRDDTRHGPIMTTAPADTWYLPVMVLPCRSVSPDGNMGTLGKITGMIIHVERVLY